MMENQGTKRGFLLHSAVKRSWAVEEWRLDAGGGAVRHQITTAICNVRELFIYFLNWRIDPMEGIRNAASGVTVEKRFEDAILYDTATCF